MERTEMDGLVEFGAAGRGCPISVAASSPSPHSAVILLYRMDDAESSTESTRSRKDRESKAPAYGNRIPGHYWRPTSCQNPQFFA